MKKLVALLFSAILLIVPVSAFAETTLDANTSLLYESTLDENGVADDLMELGLHIGLSETFVRWITFSGQIGVVYAVRPGRGFHFDYHLTREQTRQVWGISLLGQVAFHLPSELVGLGGGIWVRSFFMPTRSGLFRVDAFAAINAKLPIREAVLRGFVIGVRCLFPLVDDFETVFEVQTRNVGWSIYATWQF